MCEFVYECMHMSAGIKRSQKIPLGLELQVVVRCLL